MEAVGVIFLLLIMGGNIADEIDPEIFQHRMTAEERHQYNSIAGAPECVFDETGNAINRDEGFLGCADWRNVNKQPRPGFSLKRKTGHFVKTPEIDPARIESIEIPEGMTVVWYSRVSDVEALCYDLIWETRREEEYPVGCYDERFNMAHVVYGDAPTLIHEIRHVHEGAFHE